MSYRDANPVQAEAFIQTVRARDVMATKKLVDITFPNALWGSVMRSLTKKDREWAERNIFSFNPPEPAPKKTRKAKKEKPLDLELIHGHCADVLMKDYGVPKKYRKEVCEQLQGVWKQGSMIHTTIIYSVRGYDPKPQTRTLEIFLERHATHAPLNHRK